MNAWEKQFLFGDMADAERERRRAELRASMPATTYGLNRRERRKWTAQQRALASGRKDESR